MRQGGFFRFNQGERIFPRAVYDYVPFTMNRKSYENLFDFICLRLPTCSYEIRDLSTYNAEPSTIDIESS